jgi:UDP:flavonoid glycosyltransferase YjiC (YdhE family)
MKRILIATAGSHGDVLPFIALARKFAHHGHEPVFYTNPFFRDHVEDAGIRFVPVRTVDQYATLFEQLADGDVVGTFRRIADHACSCVIINHPK